MKIVVDSLGGDHAPLAVLEGCAEALKQSKELTLVIAGRKEEIEAELTKRKADLSRVEILPAKDMILNTDHPSTFFREKPEASLSLCVEALRKRDDIDGMVSAGPTGAILTGAMLRVGRIPGVIRPALLASLPTRKGGLVRILDAGANMDCKPEYLLQFAIMGDAYLRNIGVENPRIALLNVGKEDGKGNDLTKEAFALLKQTKLNFVGSVEGDGILNGDCDLIVTDGFSGNVALKSIEGGCFYVKDLFKDAISGNIFAKFGALFQLKGLKKAKVPFTHARSACAPMLGVKKPVLKCHGKSLGPTFAATILQAEQLAKNDMNGSIASSLSQGETKEN